MKHTKTLSRIATAFVNYGNSAAALGISRAQLLKDAEHLTHDEKRKVDVELVNYYADKAGVMVAPRSKGESIYGPFVAVWERDDAKQVAGKSKAAAKALSDLRSILFAVEIGKKAKKAGKSGKATTPAKGKAATLAQVISFAEARVAAGTKPTAEEKKELRRVATMLLGLISQ